MRYVLLMYLMLLTVPLVVSKFGGDLRLAQQVAAGVGGALFVAALLLVEDDHDGDDDDDNGGEPAGLFGSRRADVWPRN